MRVGVDVGGTFTDVAAWDGERLHVTKLSTSQDQSEGVMEGAQAVAGSIDHLLHGTTVATNALLERSGAATMLVTSAGFEDVLEIARQDRPSLYDVTARRSAPLVTTRATVDVVVAPTGSIERRPNDWDDLIAAVVAAAPDAVAVSLLYGFAAPELEAEIAQAIRGAFPNLAISTSHEVAREFREFERASTTVLNAYLTPATAQYLGRLSQRAESTPLSLMRSSGGVMPVAAAAALPAAVLLSGPAGGVVAAAELGRALGYSKLVSFDMGGTSTDVCRIENADPQVAYQRSIDGHPCQMPALAVHTVGAGGGSLGWRDEGGALRVGPASAGARPGPAAYGRGGTDAAVTDANAHLGRLGGTLADDVVLDLAAARNALTQLGEPLGMDPDATAAGVLDVVEAHMSRAIRNVTVEEGADPRGAVLVAFGGAGGLHAASMAAGLGMHHAVVPSEAGVFSALGLLMAPPRVDLARSLTDANQAEARASLARLEAAAFDDYVAQQGSAPNRVDGLVDLRYIGQSHETTVSVAADQSWDQVLDSFHQAHHERNGFSRPNDPVEAVTVRASALGRPGVGFANLATPPPEGDASLGTRQVHFDGAWRDTPVFRRPGLGIGWQTRGPAVIAGRESTIFVPGGHLAEVIEWGAVRLSW